jgi:hypothetical protein
MAVNLLRECQGVAPKEPLERNDGHTHHTEVDHTQSILPTQKTRVEEPKSEESVMSEGSQENSAHCPHPTPGIMIHTRAVDARVQAMSPSL